jgi:hypothetical protein
MQKRLSEAASYGWARMRLHLAHLAGFVLRTRVLLDLMLYNETENTKAKSPMDEAKKRGKENAR